MFNYSFLGFDCLNSIKCRKFGHQPTLSYRVTVRTQITEVNLCYFQSSLGMLLCGFLCYCHITVLTGYSPSVLLRFYIIPQHTPMGFIGLSKTGLLNYSILRLKEALTRLSPSSQAFTYIS